MDPQPANPVPTPGGSTVQPVSVVTPPTQTPDLTPPAPDNKKTMFIFVVALLIGVLAIGGIVAYFMNSRTVNTIPVIETLPTKTSTSTLTPTPTTLLKTEYANPFDATASSYQNPFSATASSTYTNPFSTAQ
jgi:hypothetical protein